MKKKIIVCILILLILVIPIPTGIYKDGGTRTYSALTYKIVKWKRLNEVDDRYEKTRVYFGLDAYRSIDDLWERETPYVKHTFLGKICEINGKNITVEPIIWEGEWDSSQQITFQNDTLKDGEYEVGTLIQVIYKGEIQETYPATVNAISCEIVTDFRDLPYWDVWLSEDAVETEVLPSSDLIITQIYADCFIATSVEPSPIEYKVNGQLHKGWTIGDQVSITYTNAKYDETAKRIEADMKSIKECTN